MRKDALSTKQENIHLLRQTLYHANKATVKELAEWTALSPATIGTILSELLDEKEILEGALLPSAGGRPAREYVFNNLRHMFLLLSASIQQGQILIQSTLTDLYGAPLHQKDTLLPDVGLADLERIIGFYVEYSPQLLGVVFSLPGVEQHGRITLNDYQQLIGVDLGTYFWNTYQLYVIVENDINAATKGFAYQQNPIPQSTVGLYFPQRFPPGAGLFLHGKIWEGYTGHAGEIATLFPDIVWDTVDYSNPEQVLPLIVRFSATFCKILDPEALVIYQQFLTQPTQTRILEELVKQGISVPCHFSSAITADMQVGLFQLAQTMYWDVIHPQKG